MQETFSALNPKLVSPELSLTLVTFLCLPFTATQRPKIPGFH